MTSTFASLGELLRVRARDAADRRAYTFLRDGEREDDALTYGELDRLGRAVAAALRRIVAPGDRAFLLYPPGLDFLPAFFGCLYAGVVAVPAYPPHPGRLARTLPRLQAIARDAGTGVVLAPAAIEALASALGDQAPGLTGMPWLATDRLIDAPAASAGEPAGQRETLAFLQYTSGSTAAPKGVMVSHGNVLANLASIHDYAGNGRDTVGVSWLPVYHDMGLIEGVLAPLFGGYPAYLIAPAAFLQRPLRWLAAITRYRATNSGGPNFAYDLCVRKTTPAERQALDLRSWRAAYNGAEPVRADTLERFGEAFHACGFERRAFYPVYGLAEATLLVGSGRRDDEPVIGRFDAAALGQGRAVEVGGPGGRRDVRLVGCGRPIAGTRAVIAHPERRSRCAPGDVGEIWLAGPGVTGGYWGQPDATERTFRAHLADTGEGPFLRTGDLGFLRDGEVFVAGRLKDLIVVRGRKHYPQDLELTVERSHPAIRPGCVVAFALPGPVGERVAVAAEADVRRLRAPAAEPDASGLAAVIAAVREAVAAEHEVAVHAVALLAPGSIPKTSSGKLQRHACRAEFLGGTLPLLDAWEWRAAETVPARRGALV